MSTEAAAGLAGVLASGGAPGTLAGPVLETLGPEAHEVLRADPWRLLDVRRVRPEQADAFARSLLGDASAGDERRASALVAWHLRRAAADGHTAVPAPLVLAALAGHGFPDPVAAVEAACARGRAVPESRPTAEGDRVEELLADADLAQAEEALAEGLLRLEATAGPAAAGEEHGRGPLDDALAAHGVVVVDNPYEAGAGEAVRRAAVAAGARLVQHAELLGVPEAAALVESLPDGSRLVLAGDALLLPGDAPGAVLTDCAGSGVLPVVTVPPPVSPVAGLVAAVRAGHLPAADDPERHVVVLPTTDADVVDLAVRVVADSVPRVHGVDPGDVVVVAPCRGGAAGTEALDQALTDRLGPRDVPRALTVHEARGRRWPAAVVVLPAEASGRLSRALVATACGLGRTHVTVLAAAGPAIREAVERVPPRRRSTRLPDLLRLG